MSHQPVMSLPPAAHDVPQGFVNAASARDFSSFHPPPQSHYFYTGQFHTGPDYSQGPGPHKGGPGSSYPPPSGSVSYAGRSHQERAFRGMVDETSNSSAMRGGDYHPSHSQEHSGLMSSPYGQKGQEHYAGASGGRYGNPAMSTYSPMRASGAYAAVHSQFMERSMQGYPHYPGGNEQPMEQPLPSSTPHGFSMYDAAAGNPSGKPSPTERGSYHPYGAAASMPQTRPPSGAPPAPAPSGQRERQSSSPGPSTNSSSTSVITEKPSTRNAEPPAERTPENAASSEQQEESHTPDEDGSETPPRPTREERESPETYPKVHVITPNPDVRDDDTSDDKSKNSPESAPALAPITKTEGPDLKREDPGLPARGSINTPPPLKSDSPRPPASGSPSSPPPTPSDCRGEPDSSSSTPGGSTDRRAALPHTPHPASNPSPSRSTSSPPPPLEVTPDRPASSDPSFRFDDPPPPSFDDLRRSLSADESSLSFTSPPRHHDHSAFTPHLSPSPARTDSSTPSTPLQQRPFFSPHSGGGSLLPLAGLLAENPAAFPGDVGNKDLFFCHLCSYVGTSKYHFNLHMNSHFEHRCPHCDYTSRTEGRLKRHIKDFHTDEPANFSGGKMMRQPGRPKLFRCKQCDFVAEEKVDFWAHTRTHIKEDKILQCPKCPFVTEYKHHLEYHLRNHFGSKPFKCSKCNYACVNKSMLNSHMKSHTNVYQYRCADCTYATKYCHSLKLHLRKYNHKPATVLNPDGSLPTDGSGDFELVSKRGPPRGPRGPRKENSNGAMPPMSPIMFPPHMPPGALNGSMLGPLPGYWPLMGQLPNGLPPPPLIPVSAMGPLMPMPNGLRSLMRESGGGGGYKCLLCDFCGDDRHALDQHMLKVHAAENQDLFKALGLRAESLAEEALEGKPFANGWLKQDLSMSPKYPMDDDEDMEEEEGKDREVSKRAIVNDLAANIEAEARQNGECPLDLTKPKDEYDHYPGDYSNPLDFSPGRKRSCHSDEALDSPNTSDLVDRSGISPTPRKRSRKGKAYKLDTICMKLQERYGPESPSNPEEYDSDPMSDYSPAKPDVSNGKEAYLDGETRPLVASSPNGSDHPEVHSSLHALNRSVDSMLIKYTGSRDNSEHRDKHDMPSRPMPALLPAISNRRKLFMMRHAEDDRALAAEQGDHLQPGADGNYECQHCHIVFKDCIMYTMHMGYHGYQDPFKCNMCGQQAKDRVEFFLHIARAAHD